MTQYKVGDEVLVRGKIAEVDSVDGTMRIRFQSVGYGALWIFGKFIYSLAPEFTPEETLEFSNGNGYWHPARFGAYIPASDHPYITIEGRQYKQACRVQPKDQPVTAEEIREWHNGLKENEMMTPFFERLVKHFKGRVIGGQQ